MNNTRCYKIFIAHTWAYNESYYRVSRYLDEISDFNYEITGNMTGWSSIGEKPSKEVLIKQMAPAEIIIVNSEVYKNDKERLVSGIMEAAVSNNKPIIGIDSWGPQLISSQIVEKAKAIVPWDPLQMVEAIRRYVT